MKRVVAKNADASTRSSPNAHGKITANLHGASLRVAQLHKIENRNPVSIRLGHSGTP
jgi:hypothetical protein